jgi:hypothetical protein
VVQELGVECAMSYDQLVQGEMQPGVGSGAYLDHAGATPAPKSLLDAAFRDLLNRLPTPIIAFCRSGNRSTSLWTMSQTIPA